MTQQKDNRSQKPGIYLHIPFCEHKCGYCDFYSITSLENSRQFVQALTEEIKRTAEALKPAQEFDTIYFGGGTPSLLAVEELANILETLNRFFKISANCEITLEMNPGATELVKLPEFYALGINRLSIGIQSFDDEELRFLERIHTARQAEVAFEQARKAGFKNISIDLIYALPGQTLKKWERHLNRAVKLGPEHISAYNLIFEPGTPFYAQLKRGTLSAQSEENELAFFHFTQNFLRDHGFPAYEVSNYARSPQFFSRHNYKYWTHAPYLGFGPSAHSFWSDRRWANVRSLSRYLELISGQKWPRVSEEKLDASTKEFEHIFLRLRTIEGLNLPYFEAIFKRSFQKTYRKTIELLIANRYAMFDGSYFKLTQRGLAVCDEILQQFA